MANSFTALAIFHCYIEGVGFPDMKKSAFRISPYPTRGVMKSRCDRKQSTLCDREHITEVTTLSRGGNMLPTYIHA